MFQAANSDAGGMPQNFCLGGRPRINRRLSHAGISLIELSVVVAIMGVVALVTVPNLSPPSGQQLQLAANIVADALRFARSESIRTGQVYGVSIDANGAEATTRELTVYQVNPDDLTDFSAVVSHPLREQFDDLQLGNTRLLRGVSITNALKPFEIQGIGSTKQLHFNAAGDPVYTRGAASFPLLRGEIRLRNGQRELSVVIDPMTGRVAIR